MAKFAYTTDGHFVNLDMITTVRVKGEPGAIESLEVWFAGSPRTESGLYLGGEPARELFEEIFKTHEVIGYPSGSARTQQTEKQPSK
jgi:hypothetical protein